MFAVLQQLAIAIVQAAGTDAYQETRKLIIKHLSRFRSRARLEEDLDATRKRVREDDNSNETETDNWAEELAKIAAISDDARQAIYALSREINYNITQQNVQQSGNHSPNQNVNITITGGNSSANYDRSERVNRRDNEKLNLSKQPNISGANSPGTLTSFKAIGVGVGVVVFVIIIINSLLSSHPNTAEQFPQHGSTWPAGATINAVLSPVINGLSNCAQEPVLSPVNCPQSQSDSYSDASNVHWSLHGDPTDGAAVVYTDKQFQVAGNAVMTVTYRDTQGSQFLIDLVHYRAWVAWNDGHPRLISITNFGNGDPPVVSKHKKNVSWVSLISAVKDAFRKCVSYRTAPLPPQCPVEPNSYIEGSNAFWQLNNDPLLNASEGFDTSLGLINVTGSFYMSVKYDVALFGTQSDSEAGNYKAIVAIDHGKVDVLQIQYEN